jgi:hypothetical protein
MMFLARHELSLVVAAALWLGAVVAGFAAWEAYDATPGESGTPLAREQVAEPTGRWSLVMFVHPRCDCTRASLTELGEVVARTPARLDARVVFVRPAGAPDQWERGELWDEAGQLPGVRVECDAGGVAARRVGATASGHVVLRAPDGRLAFSGGITKARGRVGDSAGRRAVLTQLRGEPAADRAPTFGCPLFSRSECCLEVGNTCQPCPAFPGVKT